MDLESKIKNAYITSKNYPELVKALIGMGMRSYTVDVATGITLYRFAEGENSLHTSDVTPRKISERFNKDETYNAVKDTQRGMTTYPEFMDTIAKSGVRFYEATLSGEKKRVTYIGSGGYYEELIPL